MASNRERGGASMDSETSKPDSIIDRDAEWNQLTTIATNPGVRHLHLYGPRGTGKTLLAEHAVQELPDTGTACYVPCLTYDTQYKVLQQLFETVTNEEVASGYHTSQLQDRLADQLASRPAVIVLDEVDFLLVNDGSDLLYYLSRIADGSLSVITISANHSDLSKVVDERTYSSLQPRDLSVAPYTEQEAAHILRYGTRHACDHTGVSEAALTAITTQSTDIRFGLHWVAAALREDDDLTAELIRHVRSEAVQRYWETLLTDFSPHHDTLLDAIDQLTTETTNIQSGTVYERYTELCWETGHDPLTTRRISDYLTHLELLGIIDVDHHYGGKEGKTRLIQLQES